MGTFLASIQVLAGAGGVDRLLEGLAGVVREKILEADYEETDDPASADRSVLLQVSSDSWISIYDQRLDEQDIGELDALGKAISARLGVPAVGAVLHDSDLLVMRLYLNGKLADTIVNDLDLFNEMLAGSRPRKRNGVPSKWTAVCEPGARTDDLKGVWEQKTVFADDALALAADLLAIPREAALRGYGQEPASPSGLSADGQQFGLHFRSAFRFSDYFEPSDAPLLAFTSWASYASGDAGVPSTVQCGLTNQGQAFSGLDVLLWGPAFEERLIEPGQGMLIRVSSDYKTRDNRSCEPHPFTFNVQEPGSDCLLQKQGYRYEFPESSFPEGFTQIQYPETAARMGIFTKWMERFYHPHHFFQLAFTGTGTGDSEFYAAFVPTAAPEGQLTWRLPTYIGVEPPAME
ncbi:hypothetical protein [Cohnella hashimotonis]|uniref:Uncharacterized protein n=1 Tax=Cohnella hashimotonis TaxID=2826895 RepID=A0ABT6TQQ9_9BACL|nr:hypothetical protein [Cohnella hashimotonis]MDI4649189.1 hypothetical protein [Cohnella hashimotonis]